MSQKTETVHRKRTLGCRIPDGFPSASWDTTPPPKIAMKIADARADERAHHGPGLEIRKESPEARTPVSPEIARPAAARFALSCHSMDPSVGCEGVA